MNLWNYWVNKSTKNRSVQVMHQTVLEFFRSSGPTSRSKFQISEDNADLGITITSIRYLMLCTTNTVATKYGSRECPILVSGYGIPGEERSTYHGGYVRTLSPGALS
jgi:hypothetical protein